MTVIQGNRTKILSLWVFWDKIEAFVKKSKTWKPTQVPAKILESLVWFLKNPRSCVDLELVSWKSKILRGLGVDVVGSSTGSSILSEKSQIDINCSWKLLRFPAQICIWKILMSCLEDKYKINWNCRLMGTQRQILESII